MSMRELSERLKQWRCERPDEWTMDAFIGLASALEHKSEMQSEELDRLRAELAEARRLLDESRKQEPVAKVFTEIPAGTTHIRKTGRRSFAGGEFAIYFECFKKSEEEWFYYYTDNDNEYPQWRRLNDGRYRNPNKIVNDLAPLYAAPVPAQPAVPDDVAKDAARLALVWRVATGRETDEERATLGNVSPNAEYDEFVAGIDAAILSTTEGRKDV